MTIKSHPLHRLLWGDAQSSWPRAPVISGSLRQRFKPGQVAATPAPPPPWPHWLGPSWVLGDGELSAEAPSKSLSAGQAESSIRKEELRSRGTGAAALAFQVEKLRLGSLPPQPLKVTSGPSLDKRLRAWPPGRSEVRNWLFGAGLAKPGVEIQKNSPSARARPEPELRALAWPGRMARRPGT